MEKVNIFDIIASKNNFDNLGKMTLFLKEKEEKVTISFIKDFSITTEGFLTEIQISLDETYQKKEDSEFFKDSCITEFLEEDGSFINVSSII